MRESIYNESTKHIRCLEPDDVDQLLSVFSEIEITGMDTFFKPHPFTAQEAKIICNYTGKDLYIGGFEGDSMFAYGLLRGWDQGYTRIVLGIYLCQDIRGKGLGRWFLNELQRLAASRGASQVFLTVRRNNIRAISLYEKVGYVLESDGPERLVGVLNLAGQSEI